MYNFHSDAGHGWLAVPMVEVKSSGIKVSQYSYHRNGIAYLEEDLDAPTFMNKVGLTNDNVSEINDGDYSPIRDFSRF